MFSLAVFMCTYIYAITAVRDKSHSHHMAMTCAKHSCHLLFFFLFRIFFLFFLMDKKNRNWGRMKKWSPPPKKREGDKAPLPNVCIEEQRTRQSPLCSLDCPQSAAHFLSWRKPSEQGGHLLESQPITVFYHHHSIVHTIDSAECHLRENEIKTKKYKRALKRGTNNFRDQSCGVAHCFIHFFCSYSIYSFKQVEKIWDSKRQGSHSMFICMQTMCKQGWILHTACVPCTQESHPLPPLHGGTTPQWLSTKVQSTVFPSTPKKHLFVI